MYTVLGRIEESNGKTFLHIGHFRGDTVRNHTCEATVVCGLFCEICPVIADGLRPCVP
jgi:hypothetical protein